MFQLDKEPATRPPEHPKIRSKRSETLHLIYLQLLQKLLISRPRPRQRWTNYRTIRCRFKTGLRGYVELAVQTLVQERLGYLPMNFETIKGRVNRTISRNLKHHFRQYFGLPNTDRREENPPNNRFGSSQYSSDTRTLSGSRLLCQGNEDATPSSIGLKHCADKWVKNSLTESIVEFDPKHHFRHHIHSDHDGLVYSESSRRSSFRNKTTICKYRNLFACSMANFPGCRSPTSKTGILDWGR